MKNGKLLILSALWLCGISLSSCSSSGDDGDEQNSVVVTVPASQPTTVEIDSEASNGSVNFTAPTAWTAWTETASLTRATADWIKLDKTSGSAGSVILTFTLDDNNTGESRAANIVIQCNGSNQKVNFYIIQSPIIIYPIGSEAAKVTISAEEGDYLYSYEMTYDNNNQYITNIQSKSYYRVELKDETTISITYNGNSSATAVEKERCSDGVYEETHTASFDANGYFTSGSYAWEEKGETETVPIEVTYDSNSYPIQTKNKDGDEWEVYTLTWTNGNLTKLKSQRAEVTLAYDDASLTNYHSSIDLNWLLVSDEFYDFGAGDASKIWALIGRFGKTSKLLMTSVKSVYDYDNYKESCTYKLKYTSNTQTETKVSVTEGEQTTDWAIQFTSTVK